MANEAPGAFGYLWFQQKGTKGLLVFLLLMVLAFDALSGSSLKSTLEHPLPRQHNFKLKNTGFLLGFHSHF
jgi:hypothetical protein